MAPAIEWQLDAFHLGAPPLGTLDVFAGDDAVVEDVLVSVDVVQKQINRLEALKQTLFKSRPVVSVDQAWEGVKRQDSFPALSPAAIQAKGGSQPAQKMAGGCMVSIQFRESELAKGGEQWFEICPSV